MLAAAVRSAPPAPWPGVDSEPSPAASPGQIPLDLESALQWTLSRNPDLVAMRQNLCVSAAAVAVAERFPMSLNPSVSVDVRPWTFEHDTGQGNRQLATVVSLSWMQPIEFGHRTGRRIAIARAEYSQTQWDILQAELLALIETYRLHQTATFRRDKLRVARDLAEFNAKLVETVRRQTEAGQLAASELVLAEVENQSMQQVLQTSEQEYADALAAMRRQIGIPDYATTAVPDGSLKVPEGLADEDQENLTRLALESHPGINAAKARVAASHAAVGLAEAERIPIVSVGPVYENDESGTSFYGLAFSTPVPVLNTGRSLVYQRQMEHSRDLVALEQLRVRTVARLDASVAKWHETKALIAPIEANTAAIQAQAEKMDRLYMAGQADLLKLLSVRQRLIEAENARLDMVWQTILAYAELLEASGGTPLLGSISTGP
ncbi:MAG TPA: TolC family protein [Thermoguttaceae bacterium]|nr:TolC family protein [Thermoguttaceae bacterium]